MFETFKKDVQRWIVPEQIADPSEVTLSKTLKLLLHYMPLRAMLWFRIGSWLHQKHVPFFPGSIQRRIYRKFGLEMVISQKIGGGLYIAHPIGTVISVSELGENCSIVANVTIGMRNKWAFPKIGDRVFIGAGARILGDITIGDEALIGANAVVIRDVPAGATAVGIPAKLLDTSSKAERKQPGNPNETFQPSSNGVAVH